MPNVEQNATNFPIKVGPIAMSEKNAQKAEIWAEGSDEQVEALGGTHSAKGWVDSIDSLIEDKKLLDNKATGSNSLTVLGTPASNPYSVNLGANTSVSNNAGTAIGYSASCANAAVALGFFAQAGSSAISIGCSTKASGTGSIAIGDAFNTGDVLASGYHSIAIGSGSTFGGKTIASGADSIAFGNGSNATASNAIQIGPGTNSTSNTFSVGLDSDKNYPLLKSTGKIPSERIDVDGTTIGVNQAGKLEIIVADVLKYINGYDATKTQILKNVNGTLMWVDEA